MRSASKEVGENGKRCLVIRLGAIGDMVILSPVFKYLKQEGYTVVLNAKQAGANIIMGNPHVDEYIIHPNNFTADYTELTKHWESISTGYDKVLNFTGSIEESVAKDARKENIGLSEDRQKRHLSCDVNFYDHTFKWAGHPEVTGKNGELYFTKSERKFAKQFREKYKDKFMIVWVMSGSAYHKIYPYAELVAKDFMDKYGREAVIVTVGDEISRLLEFNLPNVVKTAGKWSVKRTLSILPHADLVIGTDTGIMHGAGCFDTPKILLLSANTIENLSKYWRNCINIKADNIYCYPCHRVTHSQTDCPSDEDYGLDNLLGVRVPICISRIKQSDVLNAIEEVYSAYICKKRQKVAC